MEWLVKKARALLGEEIILYTTDNGLEHMRRGTLNGSVVLTCGDFGPGTNYNDSFSAQKVFNPPGLSPNIVTEFYTGFK